MKRLKGKYTSIIIRYIIALVMVSTTMFILVNIGSDTGVFGYTARIVTSDSMKPTIEKNTLSIIKIDNTSNIKVGDIICFKYDNDIIHRVVRIEYKNNEKILYTKGDNNIIQDNIEVTDDILIGKVIYTFNN